MSTVPDPAFVREYEAAFYRVAIARARVAEVESALHSLKLQKKAADAALRVHEHAFTDFLIAHKDEVGEYTKWLASLNRPKEDE